MHNFYNYKNNDSKSEQINDYINLGNQVFDYLNNILNYDIKKCKNRYRKFII